MRKLVLAVVIAVLLISAAVIAVPPNSVVAADESLVGTYKLISSTRKILDTGEVTDTDGKDPKGFIMYGKDGRMMGLIVYSDRPKPESIDKMTDQQRADLFRTMAAYAGTYKFDGNKVEHHIDISWNELWTGTTVVRDIKKEGEKLGYTARPAPCRGDGKMSVVTLVWEKVK